MAIILPTDRRGCSTRVLVFLIYLSLIVGGATMVYPFLITVTSSFSTRFDYNRFSAVPRSFYSQPDRFVRGLTGYFLSSPPELLFRNVPKHWLSWTAIGDDYEGIDRVAGEYLAVAQDPKKLAFWRKIAGDYADFALDYDIHDTTCCFDFRDTAGFLQADYTRRLLAKDPAAAALSGDELQRRALELLCTEWGVPYRNFYEISMNGELWYPMHHVSWEYPDTEKARSYLRFKDAYRRLEFSPGAAGAWRKFAASRGGNGTPPWPVRPEHAEWWALFKEFVGQSCPASPTMPFAMKGPWLAHLNQPKIKAGLGLPEKDPFTIAHYNRLFGANYAHLDDVPFPLPPGASGKLQEIWRGFQHEYWPRRLIEIRVTPELEKQYQEIFRKNCKNDIRIYNQTTEKDLKDFSEIKLEARGHGSDWQQFVALLPPENLVFHSAETAYQQYLLRTYGSPAKLNEAYGWKLECIEQAEIPFAEAYTVTFANHEWGHYTHDIVANYQTVTDYLFLRGRAFFNTVLLCVLTILATLTVNPLCAYALSRFKLPWTEQILLYLLATMAFPTAVRSIPGFLLMKDLGLLNSFSALILPGLANGMGIFILKGFFDGLPRELYEAAALDGASEFQVFWHMTLPMSTPILAVMTLGAFMGAYCSWDWALLVCQKEEYWTISVWLYQMFQLWTSNPWTTMAGFVLASIPTAIVFITCQKVILRGIVLPAMK